MAPSNSATGVRAPAISFVMGAIGAIAFGLAQIDIIDVELVDTEKGYQNLYALHYGLQGIGLLLVGIALVAAMPSLKARLGTLAPTLATVGTFLATAGMTVYAVDFYVTLRSTNFWDFVSFIPIVIGFLLIGASGIVAATRRKPE